MSLVICGKWSVLNGFAYCRCRAEVDLKNVYWLDTQLMCRMRCNWKIYFLGVRWHSLYSVLLVTTTIMIWSMYIIWQNMEQCIEVKVVAKPTFSVSSVGIVYEAEPSWRYTSLHNSLKNLRWCCQGDMKVKGSCVTRVRRSGNEREQIQHDTEIWRTANT